MYFAENVSNEKLDIPWKAILTSTPVWALVFCQIGHDWGFFTMVTDLPKYMSDVLKFNVKDNGIWSSLPYMVMFVVSMVSGWVCDFMVTKSYMGLTFARKFFTAVGKLYLNGGHNAPWNNAFQTRMGKYLRKRS